MANGTWRICAAGRSSGVLRAGRDCLAVGNAPSTSVPAPKLAPHPWPLEPVRDDFDSSTLGIHWQTLREPADSSWLSLTERSGHLRLRGRESPISVHHQSLVGRRLQAFHAEATTKLEFEPEHFQQMAGLAAYYDSKHWVYLRVSRDETLGKTLNILVTDAGAYSEPLEQDVQIPESGPIYLRPNFAKHTFQFSYSSDGNNWLEIGPAFESYKLSDDYCNGLAFTGTFIALCVQDLAGTKKHADFDFFEYQELD